MHPGDVNSRFDARVRGDPIRRPEDSKTKIFWKNTSAKRLRINNAGRSFWKQGPGTQGPFAMSAPAS